MSSKFFTVDVEMETRRHIEAIRKELDELRMEDASIIDIDAETLWQLEAVGYVIDLHSGDILRDYTNGEEA